MQKKVSKLDHEKYKRSWRDRPGLKMCREQYEKYTVGQDYQSIHKEHELMRAFLWMKESAKTFAICDKCEVVFNYTDHPNHHTEGHAYSIAEILKKKGDTVGFKEVFEKVWDFFETKGWYDKENSEETVIKVLPFCHRTKCGKVDEDSKKYKLRTEKYRDLEKKIIKREQIIYDWKKKYERQEKYQKEVLERLDEKNKRLQRYESTISFGRQIYLEGLVNSEQEVPPNAASIVQQPEIVDVSDNSEQPTSKVHPKKKITKNHKNKKAPKTSFLKANK